MNFQCIVRLDVAHKSSGSLQVTLMASMGFVIPPRPGDTFFPAALGEQVLRLFGTSLAVSEVSHAPSFVSEPAAPAVHVVVRAQWEGLLTDDALALFRQDGWEVSDFRHQVREG